METVTTLLKAERAARGWSQSDVLRRIRTLAEQQGIQLPSRGTLQSQFSRWENGHIVPTLHYQRLLCDVYRRTHVELGFPALPAQPTPTPAPAPPVEPDAAALLALIARSAVVDDELIRALQGQTDSHRRVDRQLGAVAVFEQSARHVGQVHEMVSFSTDPASRRRLAWVLADAAALSAWQALDLGHYAQSWTLFETAKQAAREADDPNLYAFAAAEQGYVLIDLGRPAEAAELISHVRADLGRNTPRMRSWLHAAHAEAAAWAGNGIAAIHSLEKARQELPDGDGDEDLPFLALNAGHLARWEGHCLAQLGDADAVTTLSGALAELDPTFTRARSGLLCDLSTALVRRGDVEAADAHSTEAATLAAQTGSARQRRRIERVHAQVLHLRSA